MSGQSIDQFVGGKFAWFTGVVEDTSDPLQMGRVRVRCFGYHTEDKGQIPTESLPWALVMTPITSASMSGIGTSATGVLPGSWVVGFFRDGPSAQDPLVMGTIPSQTQGGNAAKGFSDPSGQHPRNPGETDTPREARAAYANTGSYVKRKNLRSDKVETASPAKIESVAVPEPESYYTRKTWSSQDVDTVVNPIYPFNSATHTQSGHVFEVDDSPGAERIFQMHTTGTYYEIDSNGNKTTTINGDNYTIIVKDDNVYVKGSVNLTINGDLRTLVKGNYHLEVEGNKTENIKGSRQSKIGASDQTEIDQEEIINVKMNRKERIGGELNTIVDGKRKEIIGDNSDVTVKGDDSHLVMGSRTDFTSGIINCGGASTFNMNSTGAMNIETLSNMNFLTIGSRMEIVLGNHGTMSLQDYSVYTVGGASILVGGPQGFTTTVATGAYTTNVLVGNHITSIAAGTRTATISAADTVISGSTNITTGALSTTAGNFSLNAANISATAATRLSMKGGVSASVIGGAAITLGTLTGVISGGRLISAGIGNVKVL